MTTIHAQKQKTVHFPNKQHSLGGGQINIDIAFPGDGQQRFELCRHRSYLKKGTKVIPGHQELLHIILPKNNTPRELISK